MQTTDTLVSAPVIEQPILARPPAKLPTWRVTRSPETKQRGIRIAAQTKSEARAVLRDLLGLEFLPAGLELEREPT